MKSDSTSCLIKYHTGGVFIGVRQITDTMQEHSRNGIFRSVSGKKEINTRWIKIYLLIYICIFFIRVLKRLGRIKKHPAGRACEKKSVKKSSMKLQ